MEVEPGWELLVDDGSWIEVEVVVVTELPTGSQRRWLYLAGREEPFIVDAANAASITVRPREEP